MQLPISFPATSTPLVLNRYLLLAVRDHDYGRNGQVDSVSITSGDPEGHFAVRRLSTGHSESAGNTGAVEYSVHVVRVLDRERHLEGFSLTLTATDRGRPPRTASAQLQVKLQVNGLEFCFTPTATLKMCCYTTM